MSFKLIGGGSSLDTVVNDVNQNILELKGQEVTKIIKDETGTRVLILDKDGLRTTAPGGGVDVVTASNDEFTFNSAQNVFKIVGTGTITSPALSIADPGAVYDTDGAINEVDHGLGFTPGIIGFLDEGSGIYTALPLTIFTGGGGGAWWLTYRLYVTDTVVTFGLEGMVFDTAFTANAGDYTIKYYLLQETAN